MCQGLHKQILAEKFNDYAKESGIQLLPQSLSTNEKGQSYLQDTIYTANRHLESVLSTLPRFRDNHIPAIGVEQKQTTRNLSNLTTIATIFSAVTVTALQTSLTLNGPHFVNTLFFASLVFTVGAALNSVVGRTWKEAT